MNKYIMLHPLCEQCLLEGKSILAEEVHHKISVKQGGTHDVMNLIALNQLNIWLKIETYIIIKACGLGSGIYKTFETAEELNEYVKKIFWR